jgi:hypothetical protein
MTGLEPPFVGRESRFSARYLAPSVGSVVVRGLVAFLVGLACVPAASASVVPVPVSVEHEIRDRVGATYRWLPMRVPTVEVYAGWKRAPHGKGFTIFFDKPREQGDDLSFTVAPIRSCAAAFGPAMRTFHLHGVSVHWSATYEDQQAWRCIKSPTGTRFAIWTSQSHPGGDDSRSPRTLHLAEVVASAQQRR